MIWISHENVFFFTLTLKNKVNIFISYTRFNSFLNQLIVTLLENLSQQREIS